MNNLQYIKTNRYLLLGGLIFTFIGLANAFETKTANSNKEYKIAIIIDDLGTNLTKGNRVLALPKEVATSILPFTQYAKKIAVKAKQEGHPVLIHIPMEAEAHNELLGPGALTEKMGFWKFLTQLRKDIVDIPEAQGVNNHMGSKLTQESQPMFWLMALLKWQNLYFIDSRTTAKTVAEKTAVSLGVKTTRRNVFLDHSINEMDINKQFDRLIALAKKQGEAVAIGHPHTETLSVLEKRLPLLFKQGVVLVPISEIIESVSTNKKAKLVDTLLTDKKKKIH